MNNKAVITKIDAITQIPGANSIVCASVLGNNVIVSNKTQVGDVGVFFQPDLQLSEQFATSNDLIRRKNPDGSKAGGFFEENRKVRSQPFMGIKSNGFWCPLDYITKTVGKEVSFNIGDEFDVVEGVAICNKYYTPETLRQMAKAKKSGIKLNSFSAVSFAKHVDTDHFYKNVGFIPDGSLVTITEKLHGTSFRYGKVFVERNNYATMPFWKKLLVKAKILSPVVSGYEEVNGTRNTVLTVNSKDYYDSESFRDNAVIPLKDKLHEGEIVYGEIVGYTTSGKPIMPGASTKVLKDFSIKARYGAEMYYKYGCEAGKCEVYVYRIVRTDKIGNTVEYSWPQVKARCIELGVKYVPEEGINPYIHNEVHSLWANKVIPELAEGPSQIDPFHIKEGVVLRIETPHGRTYFLKCKSYTFGVLEGYIKDDDNYVDLEEVS
jgi:hypothetical protein